MGGDRGEVTDSLLELKRGNPTQSELIPLVYSELHRIASIQLRKEVPHHSLQPTALVNEAYIRLTANRHLDWQIDRISLLFRPPLCGAFSLTMHAKPTRKSVAIDGMQ